MQNTISLSLPEGLAIVDLGALEQMIESAVSRALQSMPIERPAQLRRQSRRLPSFNSSPEIRKLCKFLARTEQYVQDKLYSKYCAKGLMPHSKLLKLSKMPADEFAHHVREAIELKLIERIMTARYPHPLYRLVKRRDTFAQHVTDHEQPLPPPAVIEALDDPEQDSDFWDLSKAIARAQAAKT